MIVSGILGVVVLGFATLIGQSFKAMRSVSQSVDFQLLRSSVSDVLTEPGCADVFLNSSNGIAKFSPTTSNITKIRNPKNNVIVAEIGQEISPGLTVSTFNFSYQKDLLGNNVPPKVNTPAAGLTTHWVDLVILAEKSTVGFGPKVIGSTAKPIGVGFITNGSNEILDCVGGALDDPPPGGPPPPAAAPASSPVSVVAVSGAGTATAVCPAGTVRTGCSGGVFLGDRDSAFHGVAGSGANGCIARARRSAFTAVAYAYCLKLP